MNNPLRPSLYENLAIHLMAAFNVGEEDAFYQARLIMTILDMYDRQEQWDTFEKEKP